jgi:hypothetical protein
MDSIGSIPRVLTGKEARPERILPSRLEGILIDRNRPRRLRIPIPFTQSAGEVALNQKPDPGRQKETQDLRDPVFR